MMLIAAPIFRSRISPVFDVAQSVLLIEVEDGIERSRREISLGGLRSTERAGSLAREGIDTLICGAITQSSRRLVETVGIRILSGVAGAVDQVVEAFCQNRLDQSRFRMPGCCNRRGHRRRGRRIIDR